MTTMTCNLCGKELIAAESMINDKYYCHTFSDEYPTCYMKATYSSDRYALLKSLRQIDKELGAYDEQLQKPTST